MKQVDMSEKAILSRLRQVDKLRTLCLALMKAKKQHDEKTKKQPVTKEIPKTVKQ